MSDKVRKASIICEVVVGLIWSLVISVIFESPALGITLLIAAVAVVVINLKLEHSGKIQSDSVFITMGYLLAFWVFIETGSIILSTLVYVAVTVALGFIEALWEKGVDNAAEKLEKKFKDRK